MTSTQLEKGFKLVELDSTDKEYQWVKQKMSTTIVTHGDNKVVGYEIIKIFKVQNDLLWQRYVSRRDVIAKELACQAEKVEQERLFHGTADADKIVCEGFNLELANPNGMFGKGIYFANMSSKSNQYSFEGFEDSVSVCPIHGAKMCNKCSRRMLVCQVALGKKFEATEPMPGIESAPDSCHSVVADKPGLVKYPEFVIYHAHQAFPGILVEYKIKT